MSKLVLVMCFLGGWIVSTAQTSNQQTPTPAPVPPGATASPTMPPPARPGDVDTIDHILTAIYDVISGPAGAPRDWDRFRSLFYPGARLIPSNRNDKGIVAARVLSPEDYVGRGKGAFNSSGRSWCARQRHHAVARDDGAYREGAETAPYRLGRRLRRCHHRRR